MTLQALLGIELPILQAPMAGAQDSTLAIAVTRAGGLGSIPCAMLSPETLRAEVAAMKAASAGPFNLNFFCHNPPVIDNPRQARWDERLRPYYREFGIAADPRHADAPSRSPFDAAMAELVGALGPAVVSFHFGLPAPELFARVRATGCRILASATTVEEARWLQAHGVDAVIAQGLEAGGHRGHFLSDDLSRQTGTFALLPRIVHAVDIPVIATGGIADASGVRAAMALGAAGVQVGSSYLLCPEARISVVHRAALQGVEAGHTALTNIFTGWPARGIVNRVMRELGPLCDDAPAFPLAAAAIAPLRREAERRGNGDFSPLWAGQNASGCRPLAAGELTRQLMATH